MSDFEHNEDAAVYRINDEVAIVFTVDFITPIVDDPFMFGEIAASNALSDIFAMGGQPFLALNIVCFPPEYLCDLEKVLQGGLKKVKESGAFLAGGHSIKDKEPKYGLAVLGMVHPDKVIRNHTPHEKDRLILTKPLGTGIIATALKSGYLVEEQAKEVIYWMTYLNRLSTHVLDRPIHSMTDITGFGLIGHLSEMLSDGQLVARIKTNEVPVFNQAREFARQDIIPGGSISNQKIFSGFVKKEKEIDPAQEIILYDAQTSGGLLISVGENEAEKVLKLLQRQGFEYSRIIGEIIKREEESEMKIFLS